MRTVDVPGGKVTFKTKEELKGRDSKLVKASVLAAQNVIEKLGDEASIKDGETREQAAERLTKFIKVKQLTFTQEEAMSFLTLQEAVAVAYLHDWTFDIPKPTMETIGDLPEAVYDALIEAAGGELGSVTTGVDFSPNPDQNSPTGPSGASNGSLRAEPSQEPASTPFSPSGDAATSGGEFSTPQKVITTTP